jgi:formate dehydrogenase maturation protein FdhE
MVEAIGDQASEPTNSQVQIPDCPTCDGQPRISMLMFDNQTREIIRLFKCDKCGEHIWGNGNSPSQT